MLLSIDSEANHKLCHIYIYKEKTKAESIIEFLHNQFVLPTVSNFWQPTMYIAGGYVNAKRGWWEK